MTLISTGARIEYHDVIMRSWEYEPRVPYLFLLKWVACLVDGAALIELRGVDGVGRRDVESGASVSLCFEGG